MRIGPRPSSLSIGFGELWDYRELLFFLIWRDVKVRYKQTALGAAWAVLPTVITLVVFMFVFGRVANVPTGGVPYPVFALAALLPWQYISGAISRSGVSVVNSASVISKVYFPRIIIPLAAAIAPLVEFCIGLVVLGTLMVYYGAVPGRTVIVLPLFLVLAIATAVGVSLWLSALNVRYRDVTHLIPFAIQIGVFVSPIAYSSSIVPDRWRVLYGLNPVAGVVEGFRWALVGGAPPDRGLLGASCVVIVILLLTGLVYFHSTEDTFADVI